MNRKNDIEKQLSQLKAHYKVPKDYFNNFKTPEFKSRSDKKHFKLKKSWMIAAGFLLLIALGLEFIPKQNSNNQSLTNTDTRRQISQTNDLFNDLSDDDIINYLSDEDPDLEFEL